MHQAFTNSSHSSEPSTRLEHTCPSWRLSAAVVLWIAGLLVSSWMVLKHAFSPAAVIAQQRAFDDAAMVRQRLGRIAASRLRPVLVMFAHPQCPCTHASLAELDRLATQLRGLADVRIVFYRPGNETNAWVQGRNFDAAQRIPAAQIIIDPDNLIAREFSASVSGETLLIESTGELLFSGGLTPGRGHEGDSPGPALILALLNQEPGIARPSHTPVFGCELELAIP